MKREIIVVNDFYADPDAVERYARGLEYYSPYANNQIGSSSPEEMARAPWLASKFIEAARCPFKSSAAFIAVLEKITGEPIDLEHWNKGFPENPDGSLVTPRPDLVDPTQPGRFANLRPDATSCRWNCGFNIKLHPQPAGTGVHNHVRDEWNSVGADGWAGIVYLSKDAPRESGLKLYRNLHGNDFEWMSDPNRWQLIDQFANIYNRLILVRGWMPHVGGPGFGDGIANGRLFQTLFFKSKKTEQYDSCKLAF